MFGSIGLKTDEAQKGLKDIVGEAESTGGKMLGAFKKTAVAIGAVFAVGKIIDFGKMAVEASAGAQAMEAQFEQVFNGINAEAEQSLNDLAKNIGALPNRIKPAFSQIASFAKVTGMESAEALDFSERSMQAVADIAAFKDMSLEQATDIYNSVLKGNTEVADSIGFVATENVKGAKALEMYNAKWKDLEEWQKQEVLLKLFQEANDVSGATGQASREMDGWENVMGNLRQSWQDFLAVVGVPLLKAVIPVVQAITTGVTLLAGAVEPVTQKLAEWLEPMGAIADMFGGVKESAEGATGAVADITGLVENWDDMTLDEKQASVETLGKEDLEALMNALGVDFESLPDDYSKDAYLNAHGADALEEVLFLTGEWHNLDLEEKEAILKAQIENDALQEAIETRDLWNDTAFISQLAEINMNDTDAEQQVLDLINVFAEVQGLEPAEVEVNAKTAQATEDLKEVVTVFDQVRETILSMYDLLTGGSIKENTDLMEQMGINSQVIGIVVALAKGINTIRGSIDRFATLVRSKVSKVMTQLVDWFQEILDIIGGIDFEQLIELILGFVATAIDTFTELVDFLLEFFEPIFTMWKNNVDAILDLFRGLVTAFNQAMDGDWSGAFETLKSAIGEALATMATNVMEAWSGVWDNVKELVANIDWLGVGQSIMTTLGNAISTGIALLGDIGGSIKTWISETLGLGEDGSWSDIGGKILDNIEIGIEKAKSFASEVNTVVRSWIAEKLGEDEGASWTDIGSTILDNIVKGIDSAKTSASGLLEVIMSWLTNKLNLPDDAGWLEIGQTLLEKIVEGTKDIGIQAGEIVANIISGINDMMTAEQFMGFVRNFLSFIATAIGGATVALLSVALSFINGFILGLLGADSWGEVKDAIFGKIEGAMDGQKVDIDWLTVLNMRPENWDWSKTIWPKLGEWLGNTFFADQMIDGQSPYQLQHEYNQQNKDYAPSVDEETDRGSGGRQNVGGIDRKGFSSIFKPKTVSADDGIEGRPFQVQTQAQAPTIDTSAVDKLIADVKAKVDTAVASIEELGRNYTAKLIDGMTKGITTNQSKVTLNIGILGNNMKSEFDKANEKANQAVTAGMNKIEFSYRSGLTRTRATIREGMAGVAEAFRSKISEVTQAGEDTGRGFYNGLNNQRGRIIALARDIASSVLSTMENALDINSPSGETEWIGDMTIEGLYNRLKAGVGRIREVTGQVADAMLFNPQATDFAYHASGEFVAESLKMDFADMKRLLLDIAETNEVTSRKEWNTYLNGRKMSEELTAPIQEQQERNKMLKTMTEGRWG